MVSKTTKAIAKKSKTPIADAREVMRREVDTAICKYRKTAKTTDFDAAGWLLALGIDQLLIRKVNGLEMSYREIYDGFFERFKEVTNDLCRSWEHLVDIERAKVAKLTTELKRKNKS